MMAPRTEPHRPPPAPRLFSRLSQVSKRSFRSHSSSFEADDERSDSTGRMSRTSSSLNGNRAPRDGSPKYAGEDTRPTSSKELSGWYAYAFAAEVYVICGMLLPLLRWPSSSDVLELTRPSYWYVFWMKFFNARGRCRLEARKQSSLRLEER